MLLLVLMPLGSDLVMSRRGEVVFVIELLVLQDEVPQRSAWQVARIRRLQKVVVELPGEEVDAAQHVQLHHALKKWQLVALNVQLHDDRRACNGGGALGRWWYSPSNELPLDE